MTLRLAFLSSAVAFLVACGGGGGAAAGPVDPPPVQDITPLSSKISRNASRMRESASCTDLKAYIADALARSYLDAPYCFDCLIAFATNDTVSASPPPDAPLDPPAQVSQTNNQTAGVDEPDIVKADANGRVYVAHGGDLIVADAFPPTQMSELARLQLDGFIRAIALDEAAQRVVLIVSNVFDPFVQVSDSAIATTFAPSGTELVFVDVSEPAAPQVTDRVWFRGHSVSERQIDGRLHLVIANYIDTPRLLTDDAEFHDQYADYLTAKSSGNQQVVDLLAPMLRARVLSAVDGTSIEALLPNAGRLDANGDLTPFTPVACEAVYRPDVSVSLGLNTLVSIDTDGANLASAATIASVSEIYTSREHVYVLQASRSWWWDPNQADETAIHQFAIGEGRARFVASGVVDGFVNNRFSLDEHEGFLRVATTQRVWQDDVDRALSTNHLFVMQARDDGVLAQVGAVRDFIRDESIFSARYIGDRGYVVTFRQVDPLFSFDLSDPFAPRLGGELEIPGFSTYMHPYDRDHLLTIGRGGDANGADLTLQLQLFDISVLDDPRQLFTFTPLFEGIEPEFAWSEAAYESRAFTFFAPESLLSIPVSMRDRSWDRSFNGFLAIDVDLQTGFSERSRVDHNDLAAQVYCQGADPDPGLCVDGRYRHFLSPRRTVVMTGADGEVFLYTMSDVGLKATRADDAETTLGAIVF